MSRTEDLQRFYALMGELRERLQGGRLLSTCTGKLPWPRRGLYFFMEAEELRGDGVTPRIVRVGTHALTATSRTTLWNRLSQHRGSLNPPGGNHRGSIFRLHVGECLLRGGGTRVSVASTWGKGGTAGPEIRAAERPLEAEVSARIGAMPFLWLEVENRPDGTHDRGYLERNSIALLSNRGKTPLDPAASTWLGQFSSRPEVRESGLWNVNHVDETYEPTFLEVLAAYIRRVPA